MPDLLSVGECMVELFAQVPLAEATSFTKTYGGDTCNALVAASRLGSSVGFITRVGDDPFRSYLLSSWQAEGIDTSWCRVTAGCNGLYLISQQPQGEREFIYYRKGSAASTLEPGDLDQDALKRARLLLFSGITQAISASARATALRASEIVRAAGGDVAFDLNFRPRLWTATEARAALEEVLPFVSIALPSAPEETVAVLGLSDPAEVARFFLSKGVACAAVKLGSQGVLVADSKRSMFVAAVSPSRIVDTSGAGDTFNGAFLHGLLAGKSLEYAARVGVVAASLKVEGRGAIASQPSAGAIWERYRAIYG
ncbi:MAG: sugar kinase [Chloroflexi bacterium]|nr:sugar kinase [Chloroflexota bacterium]